MNAAVADALRDGTSGHPRRRRRIDPGGDRLSPGPVRCRDHSPPFGQDKGDHDGETVESQLGKGHALDSAAAGAYALENQADTA
jgi:hypothetical protein